LGLRSRRGFILNVKDPGDFRLGRQGVGRTDTMAARLHERPVAAIAATSMRDIENP
jgi:hypothetical protein